MLWKALLGLVVRDRSAEADGNRERELPQRWRDPPPRPPRPGLLPIRQS